MKKYLKLLQENELFSNFKLNNLENILNCLSAKISNYSKKDIIIHQGENTGFIGIVLSGTVQIIKEDSEGNINILSNLRANEIFAETFAYARIKESPVTVQAEEDCEILFIDSGKIIKTCSNACIFHTNLIENMLSMIAKKNILLNQKIEILSKRSIREKLQTFLNIQSELNHSKKFLIPYNREELAFFLCTDRSALSRELCSMRDDGLISFSKNEFEIL